MKSASDSESTDVLLSIAKHSVTTKARRPCEPVYGQCGFYLGGRSGVEMRDIGHSLDVLRRAIAAPFADVIYASRLIL